MTDCKKPYGEKPRDGNPKGDRLAIWECICCRRRYVTVAGAKKTVQRVDSRGIKGKKTDKEKETDAPHCPKCGGYSALYKAPARGLLRVA